MGLSLVEGCDKAGDCRVLCGRGVYEKERSPDGIMGVVAQTTRILLTDDLDGSEASETVTFAVDGITYEIDLSDEHARQLRESVASYVDHARKLSSRRAPATKRAASKTSGAQPRGDRPDTQQVREWAKEHGIEVSERGRLSNDLIVRFQEANS